MRYPSHVHAACHAKHVRDWPLHAKVFITWGIQGWVPGVVVGYGKNRVRVRVTGSAQGGAKMLRWLNHKPVSRSPNNIVARRGEAFPPKYQPPSCLALSGALSRRNVEAA